MSDIEVTVKLRWVGGSYCAGALVAGAIVKRNSRWIASVITVDSIGRTTYPAWRFDTEAEARAAVEDAAIKALKGDADDRE